MNAVCGWLWSLSEWTGIGLGPAAPYVFGGMIGHWPRKGKVGENP